MGIKNFSICDHCGHIAEKPKDWFSVSCTPSACNVDGILGVAAYNHGDQVGMNDILCGQACLSKWIELNLYRISRKENFFCEPDS